MIATWENEPRVVLFEVLLLKNQVTMSLFQYVWTQNAEEETGEKPDMAVFNLLQFKRVRNIRIAITFIGFARKIFRKSSLSVPSLQARAS